MPELSTIKVGDGLWMLGDKAINLYLIAGEKRAILLDSGFGLWPGLKGTAERLCGLPVELFHTHAHGDHISGDGEWEQVWLHKAEWAAYCREQGTAAFKLLPLEEGMMIDLGGRTLETIHVPGHSPGSMAFLDQENRLLFSGDTVMTQPVFMMMPACSVTDYRASLEKLAARAGEFDLVYPSHQRWPLKPFPALDALKSCALQAAEGDPDKRKEISVDLGMETVRFSCYEKDGFALAMTQLDGSMIPAGQDG